MYSINLYLKIVFKFAYYYGHYSYLIVNGKEIINVKAKESEIVIHPLCLGSISKYFTK